VVAIIDASRGIRWVAFTGPEDEAQEGDGADADETVRGQ
jgi:hypothetical protein